MKSVQCDMCETMVAGEDFDAWFKAMHTHYLAVHEDVMKEMMGQPKEEGEKWMTAAKARFTAA